MLSGYMSWTSVRLLLYTVRDKLCKDDVFKKESTIICKLQSKHAK